MDGNWANLFPYLAGAFKLIVLGIGAFLAIKWHFDEDRRVREAKGEILDKPTFKKKLAIMIAFPVLMILLIVVVVYLTNKILY